MRIGGRGRPKNVINIALVSVVLIFTLPFRYFLCVLLYIIILF